MKFKKAGRLPDFFVFLLVVLATNVYIEGFILKVEISSEHNIASLDLRHARAAAKHYI